MKSIRIRKEYDDLLRSLDGETNQIIEGLMEQIGDNVYATSYPDLLENFEYVDLEISDDVYDLMTVYCLANNESYSSFINRLLIYGRVKEFDGSLLLKLEDMISFGLK